MRPRGTTLEDMARERAIGVLLNMMDDPRHGKFRRLVVDAALAKT
jgi:hypothetical protein